MIQITDEVGPLQKVLVHRPGKEVVRMTQWELEPLLFDDILSIDLAQAEHDVLVQILKHDGAEVLHLSDLLLHGLEHAPATEVATLLEGVAQQVGRAEIAPILAAWDRSRLADALVIGVGWDELPDAPLTLARLRERSDPTATMALPPLPNLMFMRDPCFTVHDRVLVGRMSTAARARESMLVQFALRFGLDEPPKFLFEQPDLTLHPAMRSVEGGDVLVISPELMLIGCSERTTPQTVERLTSEVLFPALPALQRVVAVFMPRLRSVMHLDTALTAIDRDLFLGYAPMMCDAKGVEVVELNRTGPPRLLAGVTVAELLTRELGHATQIVPCGGDDPLHQAREQWTDGANAVCLGPGRIVLYARNVRTIDVLVRLHGFRKVFLSANMPTEERALRLSEVEPGERVVFTFQGSELSRARGGARCLTMPLRRL